jgi:hypothetical protein
VKLAAAVTLPGRGGTLDERIAWADDAVARAAAAGAGLVVLPEATIPGYSHVRADCGDVARTWALGAARRGLAVAVGYLDGDGCWLGVADPDGRFTAYRKRFPSPAEGRVWRGGTDAVIVDTPVGRVGLLICADVLQLDAWRPYVGRVDAVAVAAAWPDYQGRLERTPRLARPALRWLFEGSVPYRDALLVRASAAVGAPVVFADASGPVFPHSLPESLRPNPDILGSTTAAPSPRSRLPGFDLGFPGSRGPLEGRESFSAGTRIVSDTVHVGDLVVAPVGRRAPGEPLRHVGRWGPFAAVYRRVG